MAVLAIFSIFIHFSQIPRAIHCFIFRTAFYVVGDAFGDKDAPQEEEEIEIEQEQNEPANGSVGPEVIGEIEPVSCVKIMRRTCVDVDDIIYHILCDIWFHCY